MNEEYWKQIEEVEARIQTITANLANTPDNELYNKMLDELYDLRQEKKAIQTNRIKQLKQNRKRS